MKKKHEYLQYRFLLWMKSLLILTGILTILVLVISIHENKYRLFLLTFIVILIALFYWGYIKVLKPAKEVQKLFRLFVEGLVIEDIFETPTNISPVIDETISIVKRMLDKQERLNMSKKQAEYLALQNQINPHFLYNTLEGIRSEALCAGMDAVAEMTEALATFFRYTISNVDHLVTLEDELSNIENYYIIQQYRFGDKLKLSIEYDEEDMDVLNLHLPKLTLQPIIENSIYHGIERKIGNGTLRILIHTTQNRLIITVSDDGLGMEESRLEELNGKLLTTSVEDLESKSEKKGGIAVINVNNRIKLLFGDEYGIQIFSRIDVGTDVVINLPRIKE